MEFYFGCNFFVEWLFGSLISMYLGSFFTITLAIMIILNSKIIQQRGVIFILVENTFRL